MDDYATKPIPRQRLLDSQQWIDRRPVILAADDCPDGRVLLQELVRQSGNYRLIAQQMGRKRLSCFAAWTYHFCFGYGDACARWMAPRGKFAKQPKGRSVPIVAMTGHEGPLEVQKTRSAGCVAHLTKPFSLDHLMTVLERWIPETVIAADTTTDNAPPQKKAAASDAQPYCCPGFNQRPWLRKSWIWFPVIWHAVARMSVLLELLQSGRFSQIPGLATR